MATVKMTFTLDAPSVAILEAAAKSLKRTKSEVVRQALHLHQERRGKLSPEDQRRRLQAIDELMKQPPTRTREETLHEIEEIRKARRSGGRATRVE